MQQFEQATTIMVNGKLITLAEYKKQKKALLPKKPKAKPQRDNTLVNIIDGFMNDLKVINSVDAFYRNGYRQWGNVAKNIIEYPPVHRKFVLYRIALRKVREDIESIKKLSRYGSKHTADVLLQLSWHLDDVRIAAKELHKTITHCGVGQAIESHECISGKAKRLGLKTILIKVYTSLDKMEEVIKSIQNIANN